MVKSLDKAHSPALPFSGAFSAQLVNVEGGRGIEHRRGPFGLQAVRPNKGGGKGGSGVTQTV